MPRISEGRCAVKYEAANTIVQGAQVEIGTVEVEGRKFVAMGSMIDLENGVIVGYPGYQSPGPTPIALRTWNGAWICDLETTGAARGLNAAKLVCYSAVVDGHKWHGRGLGIGMVLTLRRGARVKTGAK